MVACGVVSVCAADRVVRQVSDNAGDGSGRRREDRLIPAVIVLQNLGVPAVGDTVAVDEDVNGETLGAVCCVIVLFQRASTPDDEPLSLERQAQRCFGLVVEETAV